MKSLSSWIDGHSAKLNALDTLLNVVKILKALRGPKTLRTLRIPEMIIMLTTLILLSHLDSDARTANDTRNSFYNLSSVTNI